MYVARLSIAPGEGRLLRVAEGCLFVPCTVHTDLELLDSFVDIVRSTPTEHAVTEFVLAHPDTPPFVWSAWNDDLADASIRFVVRGDATVTTDIDSVPSLSGAGAQTWVEHRVSRRPDAAEISVAPADGSGTADFTDLAAGVVAAGGFRLQLLTAVAGSSPPAIGPARSAVSASTRHEPIRAESSHSDPAPAARGPTFTESTDSDVELRSLRLIEGDPLAALRAAAGSPEAAPASAPAAAPSPEQQAEERRPEAPVGAPSPPTGPVPDRTLDPVTMSPLVDSQIGEARTRARLCPAGHANPPHAMRCRTCRRTIDPDAATITVASPVLAVATLPDGSVVQLAGTKVIGRKPDADAAKVTGPNDMVTIEAPAAVSRTHVVIAASGWSLTAMDCASSSGTALVVAGGADPIRLTPWMPHEIAAGDALFLGGPTEITIGEPSP